MIAQLDTFYLRLRPFKAIARLVCYFFFEGRPLTTRGRWINPFVFMFQSIIKKIPALKIVKKPVFILGTGRSGTTILGIVLSAHKNCAFLNEPKALWHSVNPHEDLVGNYTSDIASYRLDAADANKDQVQHIQRLYGACLFMTGSDRIIDKYPEMIFRSTYIEKLLPDAQFIFLIRNGWDTCSSINKWSKRHKIETQSSVTDWWGTQRRKWELLVNQLIDEHDDLRAYKKDILNFENHVDMAATEWLLTMREGLALTRRYPDSTLSVRFEELSCNPGVVLKDIEKFLGLEADSIYYTYGSKTLRPVPAVKPMPLHPTIDKPFKEMMARLGYDA